MDELHGDGSDHEACPKCGFCVRCGDCAKHGCGDTNGVAAPAKPEPSAQGPAELWLQLHGDCHESELSEPVDYTDDSVTWCWHRVHASDVRYVRADLAGNAGVEALPCTYPNCRCPTTSAGPECERNAGVETLPGEQP